MAQPTKEMLRDQLALAADEIIRLREQLEERKSSALFAFVCGMAGGVFAVFMGMAGA